MAVYFNLNKTKLILSLRIV